MRKAAENGFSPNLEANSAYESVWALAFALNHTSMLADHGDASITGCMDEGSLVPLHMFNYSNALLGCIIKWSLEQTDFIGVTVSIVYAQVR